MHTDRNNLDQNKGNNKRHHQVNTYGPAGWLSTGDLEDELFHAIRQEVSAFCGNGDGGDFSEIDDYFAGDDNETETERRRSLLRLLGTIRPQLADLLSCPPSNVEGE
jgi:hypothetical protein